MKMLLRLCGTAVIALVAATTLQGQAVEPVMARVKQERAPFIETLRSLV
jgi:hypothetical protein